MSETVYVVNHTSRDCKVYHTNKDCNLIKTEARPKDKDKFEAWGYRQCKLCAGDGYGGGKSKNSRKPLRDMVESGEVDL
jgi:hypothetical protein